MQELHDEILVGLMDTIAREQAGMSEGDAERVTLTVIDMDSLRWAASHGLSIGWSSGPAWFGESGGRYVLKTSTGG